MIKLNDYLFDSETFFCSQKLKEIEGRKERYFTISGCLLDFASVNLLKAEVDRILDEASKADFGAILKLHSGRHFHVEREDWQADVSEEELVAGIELVLKAEDSSEYSDALTEGSFSTSSSPHQHSAQSQGNIFSLPVFTITALGFLVNPQLSDGEHSLKYLGTVATGEALVIDSNNKEMKLEGEDALPYSEGEFPVIEPEGSILEYSDDPSSSHQARVEFSFLDRWW